MNFFHNFSGENPKGMAGGGKGNADCRKSSSGELFSALWRSFDVSDSIIRNPGFESTSGGVGVLVVDGIMLGLGMGCRGDLW